MLTFVQLGVLGVVCILQLNSLYIHISQLPVNYWRLKLYKCLWIGGFRTSFRNNCYTSDCGWMDSHCCLCWRFSLYTWCPRNRYGLDYWSQTGFQWRRVSISLHAFCTYLFSIPLSVLTSLYKFALDEVDIGCLLQPMPRRHVSNTGCSGQAMAWSLTMVDYASSYTIMIETSSKLLVATTTDYIIGERSGWWATVIAAIRPSTLAHYGT